MAGSMAAAMRLAGAADGGLPGGGSDHPDLIVQLLAVAQRDGLSGVKLSRRIGVDPSLLVHARRSDRARYRLGIIACAKIVRAYPELSDAVTTYLADRFGWDVVRALAALGTAAETVGIETDGPPGGDPPPDRLPDRDG